MRTRFLCAMGTMIAAAVALVLSAAAPARADDLDKGFASPPKSVRPWVYWFPLNGNLTKEGITADLEAMARVGIGGVLYMEVNQGAPYGPAEFAGPLWRELFKHACNEASRLGLEINMNNDAGWCGSGGPWITPELSMQKVVWTDTFITGGKRFEGALPQPAAVKDYYRDIAVMAFPTPVGDNAKMSDSSPKFTTSGAAGKNGRFTLTFADAKEPQWVQIEFPTPFTACMCTASAAGPKAISGNLQVSDDGKSFKTVASFSAKPPAVLMNFEPVTGRFFRLVIPHDNDPKHPKAIIGNIDLSRQYRVAQYPGKTSLTGAHFPAAPADYAAAPAGVTIPRDKIVDLTSQMDSSGKLAWDAPPGNWTIMRIGHTTTGKDNHPAPETGRGLECDKLSKDAARAMFNGLMGRLVAENAAVSGTGKALVATHIDSWEVGSQNWTPRMREEFQRRRGYDLWKFLPAYSGRVVDSLETTERFLWDLRQTVSDLLVENYAGEMRRAANEKGLRLSIEAYGEPADDMAYAGQADEPMAEFWSWGKFGAASSCTEMASAAHTYGKKILGAEAFTARDTEKWQGHPANIKDLGDWAFCEGINRFVFHRYATQPWLDRAPGMSMGPWGLHYERTQTWWEQSKAWHEYLSRCQYLLQQGLFVADVAYLQAEGAPRNFAPPAGAEIASHVRGGYNFDGCTPEVVLTRMQVKDGRIVLPDGMSYRMLVVPPVQTMTPRLLRKIKELADAGAIILADAAAPRKSPSLSDAGDGDAEVAKLAAELWPKLITNSTAAKWLAEHGVKADFTAAPVLRYIHRTINGAEVYFVANPAQCDVNAVASFRVTGKQPELWQPDTGRMTAAPAFEEHDGVTTLPLRLEPSGSVFVVFRKAVNPAERVVSITCDGKEILPKLATAAPGEQPAPRFEDASKTFTLTAWVKPGAETALPGEADSGVKAMHAAHNDVLYPAPGHEVWKEADAGAGLAVGTNGVCVLEHGASHFAPVLVYPATIADWAHVAVVYNDGVPSLYLNGKQVRTGLKSHFTVHGSLGAQHKRRVAPFHGSVADLQQIGRALTAEEIGKLAQTPPAGAVKQSDALAVDICHGEIWQNGAYVVKTADGKQREMTVALPAPREIAGPWEVQFDPKWGGPAKPVVFDKLQDWSKHADAGIRYYSGTAVYRVRFDGSEPGRGARVMLDLGKVEVMAEVRLNGKDLGIVWKPPYRVDITDAIKPGDNALELRVVNLWINRQIGDEQLPEDSDRNPNGTLKSWPEWVQQGKPSPTGRFTFTSWRLWKKDDPLAESGLLGPVTVQSVQQISAVEPKQ